MQTRFRLKSNLEIIGIDIGFSANRRTSGVARLSGSNLVFDRVGSNWASRVAVIGDHIAEVAAMDGPLIGDSNCQKRVCETIFAIGAFIRRCKPGFSQVTLEGPIPVNLIRQKIDLDRQEGL